MGVITDLERDNLISELEEGVVDLIEILEDSDISSSSEPKFLKIKEHLDNIYEIIEEGV